MQTEQGFSVTYGQIGETSSSFGSLFKGSSDKKIREYRLESEIHAGRYLANVRR